MKEIRKEKEGKKSSPYLGEDSTVDRAGPSLVKPFNPPPQDLHRNPSR